MHITTEDNQEKDSKRDNAAHVDVVGQLWIDEVEDTIGWGNSNQQ